MVHPFGALFRAAQMAGAMEANAHIVDPLRQRPRPVRPADRPITGDPAAIGIAGQIGRGRIGCRRERAIAVAVDRPSAALALAAAKIRVGEAAGKVAEIAHQVHGAIGSTHEHSLHRPTRRLWSWRDECGTESHWPPELGRRMMAVRECPLADDHWRLTASFVIDPSAASALGRAGRYEGRRRCGASSTTGEWVSSLITEAS
jgi:alkylation response protein AidB-like acyl-CoA dehydrogenase